MRYRWITPGVLAPMLVAGCVSYTPRPLNPHDALASLDERAIPGRTGVVTGPAAGASAGAEFEPADGLDDRELMALAVTINPELDAARAAIGESEALLIQARTLPNPELGLSLASAILGADGFTADADLLFELLRPRERAARKAAAAARVRLSRAEVAAREYELAAQVRALAFELLVAEQTSAVLDAEVALREQVSTLVRRRREVGEATELDISVVDLELADARREQRLARAAAEQARLALNRAVGLPPSTIIVLQNAGRPLEVPNFEAPLQAALEERLLSSRLDLKAREAAYSVAEEDLRLAVRRQYPRTRVGPAFSHDGVSENYAGGGLSIEIPIFDRNQGDIAQATAARDRARAEYTAALHTLRSQAAATLSALAAARAEVERQDREVLPLLERSQALSQGAFQARELSVLEWVTARQRALRIRRAYLESIITYRRTIFELEALEGFEVIRLIAPPPPQGSSQPLPTDAPGGAPRS